MFPISAKDSSLMPSAPAENPLPQDSQPARKSLSPVVISGTGAYLPEKILANADLTRMVDTSDEWIVARTGIRERRLAADDETAGTMAVAAAREAIAEAGLTPANIDLVIVGTITPDQPFPSTACYVQNTLGMRPIPAFDVEAACSGFLYISEIAAAMVRQGPYRHALIIGTEKLSSIMDWTDRGTCILFGDGAGAAVLSRGEQSEPVGLIETILGADGASGDILNMPGGGSRCPATPESVASRQHFLKMNGREVFKFAVRVMEKATLDLLAKHQLKVQDIGCIIPHQANSRIIEMLANRMEVPLENFFMNLDKYGNTSAASIPIALHEARRAGRCRSGEFAVLVAFGAGLTWGATLIKWP